MQMNPAPHHSGKSYLAYSMLKCVSIANLTTGLYLFLSRRHCIGCFEHFHAATFKYMKGMHVPGSTTVLVVTTQRCCQPLFLLDLLSLLQLSDDVTLQILLYLQLLTQMSVLGS